MPSDADAATRRERRPSAGDYWFALLLVVTFGLIPIVYGGTGGPSPGALVVATLLGMVQLGALAWRRARPERTAVIVGAAAIAHFTTGQFLQPSDVAVLVALYSVTAFGGPRSGRYGLLAAMGGSLMQGAAAAATSGYDAVSGLGIGVFFVIGCAALSLAAWALGLMRRARFLQQESLAERAARLERERDQQAQIATQAERARIAREMHDIVAHSLSVVIAQADGGRYAAKTDPAAAERALLTISETGRAALADMRRILGVLRTGDADAAELVPQPADTDIASLVESMRDTLPVSLIEMGTPRPMPPGTGATLYRIAQESLTNILKHGGPGAKATMLLQWAPQRVVLQVDDDGRGAAATSDGAGHGVLGMRERATMLGGTLVVGPRPGGGYRVRAEIPVPGGDDVLRDGTLPAPQPTPDPAPTPPGPAVQSAPATPLAPPTTPTPRTP